ncbi:hypothetical protein D9M73_207970 [compost metagenome]
MLITALVLAIATTRSVCRERKAGSWMMSQTSATGAAWNGSWTSVMTGTLKVFLISSKIFNPSSMPGPRYDVIDERLALSKLALNT